MTHLYIAGSCLFAAGFLYLIGKTHGKKKEKQKQQEWKNKHLEEQQKQSNRTGVRNAEINKLSSSNLDKRLDKWVRD